MGAQFVDRQSQSAISRSPFLISNQAEVIHPPDTQKCGKGWIGQHTLSLENPIPQCHHSNFIKRYEFY